MISGWEQCPANFAIIEQVILARNSAHHTKHIASIGANHSESDLKKYPIPFFLGETEKQSLLNWPDMPSWLNPDITVTRETLFEAITEVEKLGDWMEVQLNAHRYPD